MKGMFTCFLLLLFLLKYGICGKDEKLIYHHRKEENVYVVGEEDYVNSEDVLKSAEETAATLDKLVSKRKLFEDKQSALENLTEFALTHLKNVSSAQATELIEFLNRNYSTSTINYENLLPIIAAGNNSLVGKLILQNVEYAYASDCWENTGLHYAAMNDNAPLVLAICDKDVGGIDKLNSRKETALFIAASRNNSKICRILLDKGADPYIYNENGLNSFQLTVENENLEIIEVIIYKASREVESQNEELDPALWLSVVKSSSVLAKMLLKAGANPYVPYGNGDTCLHVAVLSRNGDVVQTILSANSSGIDKQNNCGNTALSTAVNEENHFLTDMLLKAGADPNVGDRHGQTSLHLAVNVRSEEIVEMILNDNRSHIDARDSSGKTPLLLATFSGLAQILEILLINGADVSIADFEGCSPLHAASTLGNIQILKIILNSSNAKPNSRDKQGNTPLHYAAAINQTESVLVLMENGADPEVVNNGNRTSLHTAAVLGELQILLALVNASESLPEIQDYQGLTALHLAVYLGQTLVVNTLLEYGANPNSRDKNGFNALRVAIESIINIRTEDSYKRKWTQIIPYLLSFDSDPYIRDQEGCTSLHAAARVGNVEIVSAILNHSKIGINIPTCNGSSALNLAIFHMKTDVAKILLRNEADPYVQDNLGRTSLHLSVNRAEVELVQEILTRNTAGVNIKDKIGWTALSYAVSFPKDASATNTVEVGTRMLGYIPVGAVLPTGSYGSSNRSAMTLSQLRECGCSVASLDALSRFVEHINRIIQKDIIAYDYYLFSSNAGVIKYSIFSKAELLDSEECYSFFRIESSSDHQILSKQFKLLDLLIENGVNRSTIDTEGQTIFHIAVKSENIKVLEYFIKTAAPGELNKRNSKGETPLHIAARRGSFNMSEVLLTNGIYPYTADNSGKTALHVAATMNNLNIMQLILNTSKEGVDFRDNSGLTALSMSTSQGSKTRGRCELLVQSGADPYVSDDEGHTALHAAVIEALQVTFYDYHWNDIWTPNELLRLGFGDEIYTSTVCFKTHDLQLGKSMYYFYIPKIKIQSAVEVLLKYNSSGIDMRNHRGYTALFLAALHSSTDAFILIRLGADPYIRDHDGYTALHAAMVSYGKLPDFDYVRLLKRMLVLNNSGVNMQDAQGYTALHFAMLTSPKMVYILLDNGADPNIQETRYGWTPLHIACKQKTGEYAKALLESSKTDVHVQNEDGQTALHLSEREEIVDLLIRKGADVQQTDRRGWTVMHYSAFYGNANIMSKILLNNLSIINGQSSFGETPLSIATARNNSRMVSYLLDMGADPNLAHDFLKSPLEIAITENNLPIFQSLCKRVDGLLAYNMFGLNVLHTASWLGNLQVVEILHERFNATIDYPDWFGHTPLQYAAMGRQERVLKYLLKKGASPLVIDHLGHNVLHYAVEGCRGLVIEAMILRVKEIASNKEFIGFINKRNFLDITSIELSAFNGNREAFLVLWKECEFLNITCDTADESILFPAALGGDTGIINFILERTNLSVNWKTVTGISLAMSAAARGRREAFQLLISKGATIDDVGAYGQTLLHFGAQGGDTEIIETTINNSNVDVNSRDVEGFTPLMNAVYHDNLDATELLLNYSADPYMQNVYGEDVIRIAAKVGNAVLKSRLFNASHNPDSALGLLLARRNASFDKQVLFDLASRSRLNKYEIFLAAAKGNMTALKKFGSSPFMAKNRKFPDLMKEILNDFSVVIIDLLDKEELLPITEVRLSPLDIALLFHQNLTVVKYIIQNLKIKQRSISYKATSWTSLDYALFTHSKFMSNSSTNVLLYLLDKCKNSLNGSTNKFGWTVAHKAAWTGNFHAITFLKHYGVDLNGEDHFGRTPLHYAALNGHSQVVNTILHSSNISINKKDKHGFTPLLLSQVYNHRQFFRRFSTISSDMPSVERFSLVQLSDYLSQISKSHDDSYFQTTATLVAHKADLDVQDKAFGWTALHWAVVTGDYQCVQLLTYKGAKVNIRSWTGETPLFLARKWMRKQTYNYLKSKNGVW